MPRQCLAPVGFPLSLAVAALSLAVLPEAVDSLSAGSDAGRGSIQLGTLPNVYPVAFGTLNPGDNDDDLASVLRILPEGSLIDTAELYGRREGDVESAICAAAKIAGRKLGGGAPDYSSSDLLIATKFAPKPWRLSATSVVDACRASMARLGVSKIDLYQLHYSDAVVQPLRLVGYTNVKDELYWDGLASCYHEGLVGNVGVCNYGPETLRRAHAALAERGVPLVSNQINFNLLRYRSSLETKAVCDELGVKVLGYHPLGNGVLTGKYDEEWFKSFPPGESKGKGKARRVRWYQRNCSPVLDAVRRIARRTGRTMAQVATNWVIRKGAIPIGGARTADQALDLMGGAYNHCAAPAASASTSSGSSSFEGDYGSSSSDDDDGWWSLSDEEVAELDAASFESAEYARGFELV